MLLDNLSGIIHFPECKIHFALNIEKGFRTYVYLDVLRIHNDSYASKYLNICTDKNCRILTWRGGGGGGGGRS